MSAPSIINPPTSTGGAPVGGSGTANTIPKWGTASTLNDSVIVQSGAGFIGVGAPVPTRELDVTGSVNISQQLYVGNGSQGFFTWGGGVGDTFNLVGAGGKAISLGSNGGYDRLFVSTAGSVGVGTTSPTTALQVAKNVTT